MNFPVNTSYQPWLVALSYALAVAGSFLALNNVRHIVRMDGRVSVVNAAVTGLLLGGIGIWSMHFIGMVALKLGMGSAYAVAETALSLLLVVIASGCALTHVARAPERPARIVFAGVLLGLSVAAMHYLGMRGMRFGGFIVWSQGIVALSILIAVVAASAALWLAFHTSTPWARLLAALVMGVAVCAMHYTGMEAAGFICTTALPQAIPYGPGLVSSLQMPVWVSLLSMATMALAALLQVIRHAEEGANRTRSVEYLALQLERTKK